MPDSPVDVAPLRRHRETLYGRCAYPLAVSLGKRQHDIAAALLEDETALGSAEAHKPFGRAEIPHRVDEAEVDIEPAKRRRLALETAEKAPDRAEARILAGKEARHRHFALGRGKYAARPRGELGLKVPNWQVELRIETVHEFDDESREDAGKD